MTPPSDRRRKAIWLLPPILIGVLVLFFMVSSRQPPARIEQGERTHAVRVVQARKVDLTPLNTKLC